MGEGLLYDTGRKLNNSISIIGLSKSQDIFLNKKKIILNSRSKCLLYISNSHIRRHFIDKCNLIFKMSALCRILKTIYVNVIFYLN